MYINSTFSLILEGYEYKWKVLNLISSTKKINPILWRIPDSFLEDWTWDNDKIEEHIDRCISADLSCPIIVWDDRILDGCHRVIKTIAEGRQEIKAKIIRDIPPPDIIVKSEDIMYFKNKHNFKEIIDIVKIKLNQ